MFPSAAESCPAAPALHPPASATVQRVPSRHQAFTLIELMVVIGVIAVLLVALIPAVSSFSKSGGRKAAIGSLLGTIEQARVQAIKDGQATYVVFPVFSTASVSTLDRYHYRSFAIFEDDPANATATSNTKQLTNWKTLPTGVALRATGTASVTSLPEASTLAPAPTLAFTPDTAASATFYCIKFNASGEVEAPNNNVVLSVFEGHVNGQTEQITSARDAQGAPAAVDSIRIAQLTGRAQQIQ
jgi:prepilin-type N-terminal cleavage/methylation domain-containing protein